MIYDTLVVGAGLFGAVYARTRAEAGEKVLVIEKRPHVAGNIYTEKGLGIDVHSYGAHIFHTSDEEVWKYVNSFTRFNNYINSPVAVYKDELYNLPFNMNTFSRLWGIRTPDEAKAVIREQSSREVRRILTARAENGDEDARAALEIAGHDDEKLLADFEPANLEEQGLFLAGRDVFDKLVRGYTEKQWGRDCRELPAFIIRRLPFRFIYDNNYFNDRYQGIPEEGYTALVERILDCEGLTGSVEVKTDTAFEDFVCLEDMLPVRKDGVFVFKDGNGAKSILYTGPIDHFFGYRFGELSYRSLRFETKDMEDVDNYQGNAVVNYTERAIPYTRVIEHKHFNFGTGKGTIVTWEYPADWKKGDEPYYPVNDDRNTELYGKYIDFAKGLYNEKRALVFGGRLGQYRYYNMDQTVGEALKTGRAL